MEVYWKVVTSLAILLSFFWLMASMFVSKKGKKDTAEMDWFDKTLVLCFGVFLILTPASVALGWILEIWL